MTTSGKTTQTASTGIFYAVGIDIGGMSIKAGLCRTDGELVAKSVIPTAAHEPFEVVAAEIVALARRVAEQGGVDWSEVRAVGVGCPGTVDSDSGVVVYANNLHWEYAPLGAFLQERLGVPVSVLNDANAAALGEARYGAGKGLSDTVMLTLGTGVGSGIVLGGKVFAGGKGAGAEIGHTLLCQNGEQCSCGRRGCFEAYASATALMKQTREAMLSHPESAMWRYAPTLDKVSGIVPFSAAAEGDAAAQAVVDAYVGYLADGITNVVNVFRPQAVILGGGVCAQGENLLAPVRARVEQSVYGVKGYAPFVLCKATLGNDAGILGAMASALDLIGNA